MSRLPEDIIEENILTRLPVRSISRFRCVSKNWYHLFQNPNFIKNHLNHANVMNRFNILVANDAGIPGIPNLCSIDNNVLSSTSSPFLGRALEIDYPCMSPECVPDILGSCNGLVCIESSPESIFIWNPATREYTTLPKAPIRYPSADMTGADYRFLYGFGFDCKNDDYKVLRMVDVEAAKGSEARVYSLRSNSWKILGLVPYDFSFSKTNGILLNGVLHWVATVRRKSGVIVCYNISNETFHHVPLPNNSSVENPFLSELGVWEGKLCLLRTNHLEHPDICTHQNDHIDVWTMMDNKWSKHFKITAQMTDMYYERPVITLPNGEVLFQGGPMVEEGICLMSYDPKLERARALNIHGFPADSEVETYIETLVALNSGTYVKQ